jgi:hypothetical protein
VVKRRFVIRKVKTNHEKQWKIEKLATTAPRITFHHPENDSSRAQMLHGKCVFIQL